MSDNLSPAEKWKFRQSVEIKPNSPQYVNKKHVDESAIALTLSITNNFIKQLDELSKKYSMSLVAVLNTQIDFFQLVENTRLQCRLQTIFYKIASKLRSIKGNQRQHYLSQSTSIAVFKSELVNVRTQSFVLDKICEKNVELEKKCRDLFEKLQEEEDKAGLISDQNLEIFTLQQRAAHLENVNSELESKLPTFKNINGDISDLSTKSYQRSLKELQSKTEQVLSYLHTFGLNPTNLTVRDKHGKKIPFDFEQYSSYDDLPANEKEKIRKLVFLMDKFGISDAAYHELAMIADDLPRSYMLVKSRTETNQSISVERLPGNVPGAKVNISEEVEKIIESHLKRDPNSDTIKIKISGDGARVSRISSFVIFSIAEASSENLLSHQEQRTIGIVECGENYDNLKKTCKPIFDEINDLLSRPIQQVNGKDIKVDFFVAADMKFIQILLGLNGATAEFACPWCKVSKGERSDLSKPWDFYHQEGICRSIKEMKKNAASGKTLFGSKHAPLLNIPVDHYIVDELHLMLRVTDVLLRNLVDDAKRLQDQRKVKGQVANDVESLAKVIQNCGVTFSIWKDKSGEYEWTSLSGSEKVKILHGLPARLIQSDCISQDSKQDVISLWIGFSHLYQKILFKNDASNDTAEELFRLAKNWIHTFLNVGKTFGRLGYAPHNITPYMHCLMYHVPYLVSKFGPLRQFSGQGVEKNNDIVKQIHQKKSNKWNSTVSCLVVRKRLEIGFAENMEREKRGYLKKSEWWNEAIKNKRSAERKRIRDEISEADVPQQFDKENIFDNKTEHELRVYLKGHGINTKVRNRDKLLALISSLDN